MPGSWAPARIEPASTEDLPRIEELLRSERLPTDGVADHLATFLVAAIGSRIIGCVGLELYGGDVLLRSLAVASTARHAGLGARLVAHAESLARDRGARHVWLLTTTAETYFRRLGYHPVHRAELPPALHASAELRGACPATATALGRRLAP